MTFTESVKTCFSKYVGFSGRATRSEYWWFFLFVAIMSAVMGIADTVIFGPAAEGDISNGLLASLFNLAILAPMMAVGWRRMHDAGKPGWYLLLPMVLSFATFMFLMMGVVTFASFENAGVDPDTLRGPAAVLGVTGLVAIAILQFGLAILLLWWLTRPTVPQTNEYGPVPGA